MSMCWETHSPADNVGGYRIWDTKLETFASSRVYTRRKDAQNRADKLDNEYGAVRYIVRSI